MNADGTGERYLVPGRTAAWSPDGRLAVAQGPLSAANGGMFVVNADGSGLRHLLERGWAGTAAGIPCEDIWSAPYVDHPAWSPDGQHIAFVLACRGEWSRLYVMNGDGSEPQLLVDSWHAYAPAWSPDGSMLAATIDGAITTIGYGTTEAYHLDGAAFDGRVDWSPDGEHIVFEGGAYNETRLYTLTLATGDVSQLIPGGAEYYADFDVAWARVQ
jgi:Tol biopolymer transport system component